MPWVPDHVNRLEDIARHAGVGVATVDRVLNERGGVSEKTTAKVLASARSLGTKRVLPSNRKRRLSIEAVLFRDHSAFYSRLNQALKEVSKLADIPATIYRTHIDVGDPERLITHLESVAENRDGVIPICQRSATDFGRYRSACRPNDHRDDKHRYPRQFTSSLYRHR